MCGKQVSAVHIGTGGEYPVRCAQGKGEGGTFQRKNVEGMRLADGVNSVIFVFEVATRIELHQEQEIRIATLDRRQVSIISSQRRTTYIEPRLHNDLGVTSTPTEA